MKSKTAANPHEIDLGPIRAALKVAEAACVACDDNEKSLTEEREGQRKRIEDVSLEDLESQSDYVLDEAKRSVRIQIREGNQAKLCAARRAAATDLMVAFLDLQ